LAQQADHFDGDLCRFRAFVTGFGASALYGLFDAVGGEHAVDDRDVVAERNVAQGFGAFADDDVKVGGRAFDDGTGLVCLYNTNTGQVEAVDAVDR